jgi:hypothetical protein
MLGHKTAIIRPCNKDKVLNYILTVRYNKGFTVSGPKHVAEW